MNILRNTTFLLHVQHTEDDYKNDKELMPEQALRNSK